MIKVKDGYGKLIGTTYKGSATQVLLSNGGNLEFSSGTKANTLVQRNANQHVYATYFNSAISDEALSDIGSVYVRNTSDTFIRRISKTQFYSIIDNKFVTLDTAQTITGVKTFSTGPILAINATITQNQNSTSNYTTVIKWLKGGTSQGTYNPSIGQHNTGGDGTGSICILPYPTETSPWNGTVGLFISKGVLRLDGKAVAIAENYYDKETSDGRYAYRQGTNAIGTWPISISIKDIRSTSPKPNDKTDRAADFWFNNTDKPGSSTWYSGITVKGWTDGYAVWQLASNATSTIADDNLYFRSGINSTWNSWRKILDTSNYSTVINGNYYTKTESDQRFVNVTGDTMTGTLTINTPDLGTQLIINRGNTTSLPSITYKNNSGILGRIGVGGSGNGVSSGQPCFAPGSSTTLFRIWHEGNDGSGSGLDADLLDGTHKSKLFTALTSTSAANLSATIGGTTLTIADLYATYAQQMATTRYFWGQPYNGTQNVTGSLTGVTTITISNSGNGTSRPTTGLNINGIRGIMAGNDQWAIFGYGTASDSGYMEIATGDNGNEPIYIAQYSGGGPYSTASTRTHGITLMNSAGNQVFNTVTGVRYISTIGTGTAPFTVSSTTKVSNLNVDLLDGYHETSFFRARGSQTIAGSIPTTTELSSNNNLSGNWNVAYPGASGHLVQFNTGSGSTRYMQFYSHYSGSLYWRNSTDSTLSTKSWKTIVDSANYTGIVLKIGTATKGSATLPIYLNAGTPTACSTTLGVSITGNAATATKLQTARTINGTSFNGTTNITTAYWGATRTITLSGAVTGSASVNGSQNVTITTTYQTGSIDGRYVGGKKQQGHGSQGTAYTADTYSSNFVNKAFVAYAERGSWSYANNGYITTNTGVNIPLAGTAIFQWGASDTNKTQLFITPHNNSGVSNPAANEMLFYTSNGSGYTSAWTRVLTHRNYTTYTVTKTGGGASGTWGISITGTAAAARKIYKIDGTIRTWSTANNIVGNGLVSYSDVSTSGRWDSYGSIFQFSNSDNPTPGTNGHWLTQIWSGTSNKLGVRWRTNTGSWSAMQTILTNTNYVSYADTRYVTALGTNGNYVTWTKNGTTNNLTVPYATASIRVNSSSSVQNTGLTYYSSSSFVVGGTAAGGQWGMPSDSQDASYKNGQCLRMYWDSTYYTDILSGPNNMGTTHGLYLRQIVNGSVVTGTFPGGWRLLLDSYNYQRYGDTRYVTLTTNQTVSGIKTFSKQQKFTVATGTSPFTVSSTTVVSNLNADLLDGNHASKFYENGYTMFGYTINASSLNVNTYYPVTFNIGASSNVRIECRVALNSGTKPSWSTHASGFSVRKIWEVNGSGWGTNPINRRILVSDYAYTSVDPVRGVGQLTNSSVEYVYVRGGGKYFFYVSHNISPILRTSTYTTNSQSVSPTTSAPAAIYTPTLTFQAGRFSALSYKPTTGINTVNIPTNTSHLTNDSGFLTGNVIRAVSANGYWGMARPDSNTSDWIRTTSAGIIPYQSGGKGSGHCGLGTSGWYFSSAYIDTVHGNLDGTATNADKLDGFHANTSQNPFGKIPTISSAGVMEVGRYLDFHYNSSDTSDYRTRLQINHSSGSYTAILPAKSGTLAMTSDIPTVTNYYWANVKVSSSSNTGTSPTFSTAYTSNWFRSNGQTGWYSQTYGGGIYMTDSSYVRVYGGKRFYAASGYLSPYAGGSWISMATRANCIVADQNNSASSAHALFRVKNSSGHAIAFGGLGANIGFYGFYASRISSGSNGTDWSTVWNVGTGVITHSKTIYTAGYYHSSVNSNNYVLLAGGSYKNLADFAKGNAGSSTQGVYVTGGTVKAMTYSLKATVNSGSSGKLAYYSGTNSIDDYTSTKGSSSTPIYLNAGVPTACSGVVVKYWGWYSISCYSSTTPTYSKKGGNFNFVTSVSRRSEGKYTVGTVYPSGYTYNNTIYWGSGRLNKAMSSNSSNSILHVTMLNGYQSGSTYYLYVNTADDSSTNDGMFDVFFLCF